MRSGPLNPAVAQAPAAADQTRYRELFESALIGIYVSLPQGRLVDCNEAFARLIGFETVADAIGGDMTRLYPSADAREAFVDAVRARRRLETHRSELQRRDGTRATVLETVVGEFDPAGDLRELRGYVVDISESVRMEATLRETERLLAERTMHAEKLESVGRLAGGIAHDFNNLLTAIIGYAELLLGSRAPDDPDRRDLQEIYQAGQRAAGLTQQLLAFSRKQVLMPKAVDLNEVVVGLKRTLSRVMREDITLHVDVPSEPAFVLIDRAQIEQAIINLALNARDALPGAGAITIDVARVAAAEIDGPADGLAVGDYVRLRVRDTGVGIPPEVQAHLFEPFFTTKEVGKGTGLGLASVHGIVTQSRGFINVTTEAGAGSTFAMHFPSIAPPGPGHVSAAAPPETAAAQPTVLLVEDEDSVRAIVSAVLRRHGYRVLEAPTPSVAIELFHAATRDVDLLVTDIVMPEMNGPALAQRLVAIRPALRILFISGCADFSASPLEPGNPNIAYLSKPFQASALKDAVGRIFNQPHRAT